MSKKQYYLMVKPVNRKQGQQFKAKCHSQKISMCKAIPLLMQMVIDGELAFNQNIKQNGKRKK